MTYAGSLWGENVITPIIVHQSTYTKSHKSLLHGES